MEALRRLGLHGDPSILSPGRALGGGALFVPNQDVFSSTTPLDYANNFGLGASYAIPDIATIVADYRGSTLAGVTTRKLDAGFKVTALKDFGFTGAYEADLGDTANLVNSAFLAGSYSMAPFSAAVDVAMKVDPAVFTFAAEANFEYTFSAPFGAGLTVGYEDGNGINWFDQGLGEFAGFVVWPYIVARFENGSSAKLSFIYSTGAAATQVDPTGAIAPNANAANQTIAVAFYYVWSF